MIVPLFDEIQRTDTAVLRPDEDTFSFLNRSAWPESAAVRRLLESFYARFPPEESSELKRKLESQFESAFFELFLHELLLRLDCKVITHPTVPGKATKPDFLVSFPGGEEVIVEAVLVTEVSDAKRRREKRLRVLFDAINSQIIGPDFFLSIASVSMTDVTPSAKNVVKFIKELLSGLDADRISAATQRGNPNAFQRWVYKEKGDFEMEISVIPRTPETRGDPEIQAIGAYPGESRWGGSGPALVKAIARKAKKYGRMERSFIIAVNATSNWGAEREDVIAALFGSKSTVRPSDFIWGVGKNNILSGVLVAKVNPWNLHSAPLCLYHNPFAERPCPALPWKIPQAINVDSKMEWQEGCVSGKLFGLSKSWLEGMSIG